MEFVLNVAEVTSDDGTGKRDLDDGNGTNGSDVCMRGISQENDAGIKGAMTYTTGRVWTNFEDPRDRSPSMLPTSSASARAPSPGPRALEEAGRHERVQAAARGLRA